MDWLGEIIDQDPGRSPINSLITFIKKSDEALLESLDPSHPILMVIREEFDKQILGRTVQTAPISLRAYMRQRDAFAEGNSLSKLKWLQAWESIDPEVIQSQAEAWEDFLQDEEVMDGPLYAHQSVVEGEDDGDEG